MSIPVGQLTIEMAANIARLQKDMDAARKSVETAMGGITKSAGLAMKALGALGVVLSAAAVAKWIQHAIDAADETNKLSQKIGVAVKDLAGLQLAFQQGGVSAESMQKGMSKLAVGVLDGNAALKAMHIETRNTDGSLRSTREIVGEVADRFASYSDGIAKTKLAIELFGKAGADLIPTLNAGGGSLDEYDSIAKKLGLTLSKETAEGAEKFNDTMELIHLGSKGVATQVAVELIPTLQNLSAQFLEFMTQGDGIQIVAGLIANTLKGIATGAVYSYYALKDFGSVISTIYEQGKALATLDFSAVVASQAKRDAEAIQNAADLGAAHDRIWKQAGDTTVDAMARAVGAAKRAAPEIGALADAQAAGARKAQEAYDKMIRSADELVASIQFDTKVLGMNNVEKETAVALQKLANFGIKEGTEEYKKYADAVIAAVLDKQQVQSIIDSNKKIAEEQTAAIKKTDDERRKIEADAAKQSRDISNQIGQSLSDALMNGGKSAKQYLVDLFRTLVLRPIVQPLISGMVSSVLYGAASSAVADTGSATGGSVGGSLGLMQAASSLKNLYDMATGSFASLGTSVSGMAESMGANLILANEAGSTLSVAGQSLVSSAASLGTAASYLGGVGAGLGLGNMFSGGLGVGGGSSWNTVAAGTAIGAFFGPLGAAAGGILGGLVNKMFGSGAKEYGAAGITGIYSATGANIRNYQEWNKPGGWFSGGSSGTDYSAVDTTLQTSLSKTLTAMAVSVSGFTKQLGLSADGISQFTQAITLDVSGLSAADAQTKMQESLTAFGDALTTFVIPAIAAYQRAGETSGAALNRLATSLTVVNSAFSTLNLKLMETSLQGADAADKLTVLFGSADAFLQSTNYYYQNFYSEGERAAKTTEQLSAVFTQLGLAMPSTRTAFRTLVEAARAAGDNTLFANLLKLAPTFNDLQTSLTNLASSSTATSTKITQLSSALDANMVALAESSFTRLQTSIQVEQNAALAAIEGHRTVAQAAKDAASASVTALGSFFDYLAGQVNELQGLIAGAQTATDSAGFVHSARLTARATGSLPEQDALSKAVSAARVGLVADNYSTALDLKLAQAALANDLTGLLNIAGDQKTTAEIQVELAQEQLDALDTQTSDVKGYYAAQLSYAQSQIDELRGINSAVLSVGDAMAAFMGAVNAARQSSPAATLSGQITDLYQTLLNRSPDSQGFKDWLSSGLSIDQIRQGFLNSPEYQSLPHFASGGGYTGGLAMVGENGPELINFDRPGMVYTAAQSSNLLSGDQVAGEIRGLRDDTRAQARALVQIQARMAKLFERWDGDGIPETRAVTA